MTLKFSDRNPHHFASGEEVFASGNEVVCNQPGMIIENPDGSESQVHCARKLGHEGEHCGQTSQARPRSNAPELDLDTRSLNAIGKKLFDARTHLGAEWDHHALTSLLSAVDDMYALLCTSFDVPRRL